jgi:hypothetical protein
MRRGKGEILKYLAETVGDTSDIYVAEITEGYAIAFGKRNGGVWLFCGDTCNYISP